MRVDRNLRTADYVDTEQLARIAAADRGVTIVSGFPASGKSTTAQYLAATVDALLIDKDSFAPALEEAVMRELVDNPYDRDSETYMRVVNPHIYHAILHQALAAGHHTRVVVDAPFLSHIRAASDAGLRLAAHIAAVTDIPAPPIRTVWIAADPDRIRERMTARGASRDLGKLADWVTYQSSVLENGTATAALDTVDFIIQT